MKIRNCVLYFSLTLLLVFNARQVIVGQSVSSRIGGNTASITTNPVNRQSAGYSVSEYILTKAQLNTAGVTGTTVTLSGIEFYKSAGATGTTNNSTNNTPNVRVYIKSIPTSTTTLTSASWSTSRYTLVYNGTYTHSGSYGWKRITFSTNFVWDNNTNLQVLITNESNVSLNSTDRPGWWYAAYTTAANGDLASQCRFATGTSALPTLISLTGNKAAVQFVYTACNGLTGAGTVSGNQSVCTGGNPIAFTSSAAASGGSGGTIEYQSESSTTSSSTGYADILGANSLTYDPPAGITQTTWYRRKARRCGISWEVTTSAIQVIVNSQPNVTTSVTDNSGVTSNDGIVCSGASATITATGASSYSWSPSADLNTTTGATVISTPTVASRVYTVIGTDANGCTASATRTITRNVSPVLAITGSNPVCAGQTVQFINTNPVLNNPTWNISPSGNGTLSYVSSGNYNFATNTSASGSVNFTVTSEAAAGSCPSNTVTLTINPLLTWYLDADADGYYASTQTSCTSPGFGWTTTLPSGGSGDCADYNPDVYTNCPVGNALLTDGVNDYVTVPDNTTLEPTSYTLACWVKPTSQPATNNSFILMQKGTNDGALNRSGYTLDYRDVGGVKRININHVDAANNFVQLTVNYTLQNGQWYHVAATYGSGSLRLYVNGTLLGNLPTASAPDYIGDG